MQKWDGITKEGGGGDVVVASLVKLLVDLPNMNAAIAHPHMHHFASPFSLYLITPGDMQLSKRELAATQMIVTTPEKWDVITRKGGDVAVASLVKLLIIDEVHLLNDERGPVIETIIARTLRQVCEGGCG